MKQQLPMTCLHCTKHVSAEQWPTLPHVSTVKVPAGPFGELAFFAEQRTHDCGAILTLERPWHDADARRDAQVTEKKLGERLAGRAAVCQ